jgi:Fe2+ transport system protein FeoA
MNELDKGQLARVEEIDAAPRTARRLAEMGVMPGATVEMLRPGHPCIVRVNQTRLSLSRALQLQVTVGPLS